MAIVSNLQADVRQAGPEEPCPAQQKPGELNRVWQTDDVSSCRGDPGRPSCCRDASASHSCLARGTSIGERPRRSAVSCLECPTTDSTSARPRYFAYSALKKLPGLKKPGRPVEKVNVDATCCLQSEASRNVPPVLRIDVFGGGSGQAQAVA